MCSSDLGAIFDGHRALPIGPVAIFDPKGDGRADRLSMANSGDGLNVILFDFLASSATVAELTAVQIAVDEIEIDAQARGKAGNPGDERLAVRLSGSDESKHVHFPPRRPLSDFAARAGRIENSIGYRDSGKGVHLSR